MLLAFPATAQAGQEINISRDSRSLDVRVGPIDIHLSGDFNCDEYNRGD